MGPLLCLPQVIANLFLTESKGFYLVLILFHAFRFTLHNSDAFFLRFSSLDLETPTFLLLVYLISSLSTNSSFPISDYQKALSCTPFFAGQSVLYLKSTSLAKTFNDFSAISNCQLI